MEDSIYGQISCLIKKYKLIVSTCVVISAVIGIISFAHFSSETVSAVRNSPQEFTNWYEQLPSEHWLRQNKTYWSDLQIQLVNSVFEISGNHTINFTKEAASQQLGNINGFIFSIAYEYSDSQNPKPILKTARGEKADKINIDIGKTQALSFEFNGKILPFDVSEHEFQNGNFPIISYIEDTEKATIFNGVITGKASGKTNLIICFAGHRYSYPIKIK